MIAYHSVFRTEKACLYQCTWSLHFWTLHPFLYLGRTSLRLLCFLVFVFPEVSVGFLWICQFEQLKKTRRLTLCSMYDFSSTSVWKLSEPQFTLYTVNNSTIYFSTEILFAPPHTYALPTSPAFYLYFKRTSGLIHLFNYFYLSPRSSYQDAVLPLKSFKYCVVLYVFYLQFILVWDVWPHDRADW